MNSALFLESVPTEDPYGCNNFLRGLQFEPYGAGMADDLCRLRATTFMVSTRALQGMGATWNVQPDAQGVRRNAQFSSPSRAVSVMTNRPFTPTRDRIMKPGSFAV